MKNFHRSGNKSDSGFKRGFGGGKSFNTGNRFGGRDGDKPAMFKAICSECNANCEIPFRPSGNRPVFCNDCFRRQNNNDGRRGGKFFEEGSERSSFEKNPSTNGNSGEIVGQLKILNSKIDNLIRLLTSNSTEEKNKKTKIVKEEILEEVVKEKKEKTQKTKSKKE